MSAPLSSVTKPVTPAVPTVASQITFTQKVKNFGASISTSAREMIKKIFDKLSALVVDFTDWCKRTFTSVSATDAAVTPSVTPPVTPTVAPVTPANPVTPQVNPVTTPVDPVTIPVDPVTTPVTPPVTQPVTPPVTPPVPAQNAPADVAVPQGSSTVAKVARTVTPTLVSTVLAYGGLTAFGTASLPVATVLGLGATVVAGMGVVVKAAAETASNNLVSRDQKAGKEAINAKIEAHDAEIVRLKSEQVKAIDMARSTNSEVKQQAVAIDDINKTYTSLIKAQETEKTEVESHLFEFQTKLAELETLNGAKRKLDENYLNRKSKDPEVDAKYNLECIKLVHKIENKKSELKNTKANTEYKAIGAEISEGFKDWNCTNAFNATVGLVPNLPKFVINYGKYLLTSPEKASVVAPKTQLSLPKPLPQPAQQQQNSVEPGYMSKIGAALWEHPKSALAAASTIAGIGIYGPSAAIDTASTVVGSMASAYAFAPITTVVTGTATAVVSTETGRNVISGGVNLVKDTVNVVSNVTGTLLGGVNWLLGRNQPQPNQASDADANLAAQPQPQQQPQPQGLPEQPLAQPQQPLAQAQQQQPLAQPQNGPVVV